jgi:hypothetical protein
MDPLPSGLSMWSRACALIDEAERRHRRFFELLAAPRGSPPGSRRSTSSCSSASCWCRSRCPACGPTETSVELSSSGLWVRAESHLPRTWRIRRASCGWRFPMAVSSVASSCPPAATNCSARSWSTVVCASGWRRMAVSATARRRRTAARRRKLRGCADHPVPAQHRAVSADGAADHDPAANAPWPARRRRSSRDARWDWCCSAMRSRTIRIPMDCTASAPWQASCAM